MIPSGPFDDWEAVSQEERDAMVAAGKRVVALALAERRQGRPAAFHDRFGRPCGPIPPARKSGEENR